MTVVLATAKWSLVIITTVLLRVVVSRASTTGNGGESRNPGKPFAYKSAARKFKFKM